MIRCRLHLIDPTGARAPLLAESLRKLLYDEYPLRQSVGNQDELYSLETSGSDENAARRLAEASDRLCPYFAVIRYHEDGTTDSETLGRLHGASLRTLAIHVMKDSSFAWTEAVRAERRMADFTVVTPEPPESISDLVAACVRRNFYERIVDLVMANAFGPGAVSRTMPVPGFRPAARGTHGSATYALSEAADCCSWFWHGLSEASRRQVARRFNVDETSSPPILSLR